MSEVVNKAVVLAAGRGKRLEPLTLETEKAMIKVGDPENQHLGVNRRGIPSIALTYGHLALAGIHEIITIQNPTHQIQNEFGSEVDTETLLRRQGRWYNNLEGRIARKLQITHVDQPTDYPKYGTGIWPELAENQLNDWIEGGTDRFVVTEADSLPYSKTGKSAISQLVAAAVNSVDINQAAILAMPFPNDGAKRYGIVQTEITDDGSYFLGIRESMEHPSAQPMRGGRIEEYKNVSRYIFNRGLLKCAYQVLESEPAPANKGEYQITDTLNMFIADGNDVVTQVTSDDLEFVDLGSFAGLETADNYLRGLTQNRPVWNHELAA